MERSGNTFKPRSCAPSATTTRQPAAGDYILRSRIPGAQGQPKITVTNTGHFLMEDKPDEFVQVILDFIRRA